MRRGDLYRVRKPRGDKRESRVFVVVSREALLKTSFSTVICAPVYSHGEGLTTQVAVGPAEGLKHACWITCDNLVSLRRSDLTDYVGSLSRAKVHDLKRALRLALDLV
ncbi:MAG: type II toxin-antitoxin system PemK/MazF family toxin [Vicinamibacteraceae bacterium]